MTQMGHQMLAQQDVAEAKQRLEAARESGDIEAIDRAEADLQEVEFGLVVSQATSKTP